MKERLLEHVLDGLQRQSNEDTGRPNEALKSQILLFHEFTS